MRPAGCQQTQGLERTHFLLPRCCLLPVSPGDNRKGAGLSGSQIGKGTNPIYGGSTLVTSAPLQGLPPNTQPWGLGFDTGIVRGHKHPIYSKRSPT